MNTDLLTNAGFTIAPVLVLGAILKRAEIFPNRLIPLATWLIGVLIYVVKSGDQSLNGFVTGVLVVSSATGLHSGAKNTFARRDRPPGGDTGAAASVPINKRHDQTPGPVTPSAPGQARYPRLTGCALALAFLCCGCASFSTTQTDTSYDKGEPQRAITTTAKSRTFLDSRSALANFKASQTDKTQSAAVGSLNQEATSTNAAATIDALIRLLQTVRPVP